MPLPTQIYRSKADECAQRARQSKSLKDIRYFRHLKQSYLALVDNDAWLAADVPPQSRGAGTVHGAWGGPR